MNLEELIIDENIDQVFALNTSLEVTVWNKACAAAFGIEKEDIIGKRFPDVFPEMMQDALIAGAIDAALSGHKSFVPHGSPVNEPNHSERHFLPLKDESGTVIGVLSITHDVAHRVKAEQELQALNRSLENFKRIIDSAHDIVITFDAQGVINYWNNAAENLFGYRADEIMGQPLSCLMPDDKKDLPAEIMNGLQAGIAVDIITKQKQKNGHEVDVAVNIFPLVDENNKFIGGCKIARDITEILKYQTSIETLNNELLIKNRQLEAVNSELTTFTNVAVNSYQETLRQLYLYFEYIVANDAARLSDPGKANIRKAQAAIQKMKLLTSDIAAFTRLNEFNTEMQQLDLNEVMKTITADLADNIKSANAKVTIEKLPVIKGFPFLVQLVFHHLLKNALKFKKDKGRPVITVSSQHASKGMDNLHKTLVHAMNYCVVTVADNGIGFDEAVASNIFQIFTRLHPEKYKGSGIGLAVCKKAMELHGGFITSESKPGEGAVFHCYFPI